MTEEALRPRRPRPGRAKYVCKRNHNKAGIGPPPEPETGRKIRGNDEPRRIRRTLSQARMQLRPHGLLSRMARSRPHHRAMSMVQAQHTQPMGEIPRRHSQGLPSRGTAPYPPGGGPTQCRITRDAQRATRHGYGRYSNAANPCVSGADIPLICHSPETTPKAQAQTTNHPSSRRGRPPPRSMGQGSHTSIATAATAAS